MTIDNHPNQKKHEVIATDAVILHGYALPVVTTLLAEIERISALAPLRQMLTPGGFKMSVAMTNCGQYGWVSDRKGYRYAAIDPLTARAWPAMPPSFLALATAAAALAGFAQFEPDACLINRYEPKAKMSLHQDKDEQDFDAPIVSVSLGMPAIFLFGGFARSDKPERFALAHGDVVV